MIFFNAREDKKDPPAPTVKSNPITVIKLFKSKTTGYGREVPDKRISPNCSCINTIIQPRISPIEPPEYDK